MRSDWQTPKYITEALGVFDLDPCANKNNPSLHAKSWYTSHGLGAEWFGRVWLNPPYGAEAKFWLERLGEHKNGIALVPPRMGARWFHDIVLSKASAILFLKGRISFINPDTGKAMSGNDSDSCLIAYGDDNVRFLKMCKLEGMLWVL